MTDHHFAHLNTPNVDFAGHFSNLTHIKSFLLATARCVFSLITTLLAFSIKNNKKKKEIS